MSFDTGEGLSEKTSPFDIYVQIPEGTVELIFDGTSTLLKTGESLIIPAHNSNSIQPTGRFKLIMTVIKSGYE